MWCYQKGNGNKLQICMKNEYHEILHQKVIQGLGSKRCKKKTQGAMMQEMSENTEEMQMTNSQMKRKLISLAAR